MSEREVAEVLSLSRSTVTREWQTARAWLFRRLTRTQGAANDGPMLAGIESRRCFRPRSCGRRRPDAFLEQACGDDRALRREVESLLSAHHEAGDFAERPAIDDEALSSSAQNDYRLLSRLGAGGMGEVFRARDVSAWARRRHQDPAADLRLDPDRLARFDREARTCWPSLNHPNICTIYGIDRRATALRCLVLELVRGHARERLAAPERSRRLSPLEPGAGV